MTRPPPDEGYSDMDCFDFDENHEDEEPDEYEEALGNCSGFMDPSDQIFWCGATGSEDCDECPFHGDIGKTQAQITAEAGIEEEPESDEERPLDLN